MIRDLVTGAERLIGFHLKKLRLSNWERGLAVGPRFSDV